MKPPKNLSDMKEFLLDLQDAQGGLNSLILNSKELSESRKRRALDALGEIDSQCNEIEESLRYMTAARQGER